ncbi:MAG: DUF971 domain-containing protein [Acidobacteria bacterium]|nr:DUF971 domain-containing protein [Acidobacteriota bacterium]
MSHEGIRFVTEEQARREEAAHKELPREATEPLKVRVQKTEGTGMEIDWKDGHKSRWTFAWLRNACPCATCHEEREKAGREPGEPKPQATSLLPMYQAPPRPDSVAPTGKYAISFHWNDGHTSGIYSWDYLRRHCVCEACTAQRTS